MVTEYFIKPNITINSDALNILEIGSYDINGSVRNLFKNINNKYIGVDLCEGKGVDVVASGHALEFGDASFDVTLSGECFEHDSNYVETFRNMVRMTSPGGLVVFTCATLGRLEHGTVRTNPDHSPGTQFAGLDYYKNLTKENFIDVFDMNLIFDKYAFYTEGSSHDLYFVGWKAGNAKKFAGNFQLFEENVKQIKKFEKFHFKIFDIPIYIARLFLDEHQLQEFAVKYDVKTRSIRSSIKSISR